MKVPCELQEFFSKWSFQLRGSQMKVKSKLELHGISLFLNNSNPGFLNSIDKIGQGVLTGELQI